MEHSSAEKSSEQKPEAKEPHNREEKYIVDETTTSFSEACKTDFSNHSHESEDFRNTDHGANNDDFSSTDEDEDTDLAPLMETMIMMIMIMITIMIMMILTALMKMTLILAARTTNHTSDSFSNTEEHFKKFDPLDVEYFSSKRDRGKRFDNSEDLL